MCNCCKRYHQVNYNTKSHHHFQSRRNCCSPCTPLTPPPSHNSSSPPSQCCSWPRNRLFSCGRFTQPSTCSSHSRCCSALLLPCEYSSATTHYFLECSDHHLNSLRNNPSCDQHPCVTKSTPHIPCDTYNGCSPRDHHMMCSVARPTHSSCAAVSHGCGATGSNAQVNHSCASRDTCPRDTLAAPCVPRICSSIAKEDLEHSLISPESPSLAAPLDQRSEHKVSLFSII